MFHHQIFSCADIEGDADVNDRLSLEENISRVARLCARHKRRDYISLTPSMSTVLPFWTAGNYVYMNTYFSITLRKLSHLKYFKHSYTRFLGAACNCECTPIHALHFPRDPRDLGNDLGTESNSRDTK